MTLRRALVRAYIWVRALDLGPRRARRALRRRRVRIARRLGRPVSSPLAPRPSLGARRRPFRLTHAVVASDLGGGYVESWPLVRRAWVEIVGVEPVLVLVANEADAPAELVHDDGVVLFPPVPDAHTAFQAQCIRLLYPALLSVDAGVVISDIDLVPLDADYFHGAVASLDERFFVTYRDVLLPRSEIAIAYNAARPETWAELFAVADLDDVQARLQAWAREGAYDGVRGGAGWNRDQRILHRTVVPWGERTSRLWVLDDDYTGHRRLDRVDVAETSALTVRQERRLRAGRFTDYHSPHPHSRFRALNDRVLDLALEARRR